MQWQPKYSVRLRVGHDSAARKKGGMCKSQVESGGVGVLSVAEPAFVYRVALEDAAEQVRVL